MADSLSLFRYYNTFKLLKYYPFHEKKNKRLDFMFGKSNIRIIIKYIPSTGDTLITGMVASFSKPTVSTVVTVLINVEP